MLEKLLPLLGELVRLESDQHETTGLTWAPGDALRMRKAQSFASIKTPQYWTGQYLKLIKLFNLQLSDLLCQCFQPAMF